MSGQAATWVGAANTALANGDIDGIGSVRVMNLSRNGVQAQDQLILVPTPDGMVAGVLVLAGLGLGYVRRSRMRRRLI